MKGRYKKLTQIWLVDRNCFSCLLWNWIWEDKAISERQRKQCYPNIRSIKHCCQEAIYSHYGPEIFIGSVYVQTTQAWWLLLLRTHSWEFFWTLCPIWTFQAARGKAQVKDWNGKPLLAALKTQSALVNSSLSLIHVFSEMVLSDK